MSDRTDDLLISVSTDLSTIKRQLKQLDAAVGQTASGIQKQFDAAGRGIDKSMTTALQSRINDMVGIGTKGVKEWQGVLADQGKEFERLRSKINPVFATIQRYKASVTEIQSAHRLGAVSADEMTAAINRERTAALAGIAAIKQRNGALADTPNMRRGGTSFNTANIAAQFQDIGVTAAMGMSPIQIALQQGTQLSSVLNQVGGTKGAIKELGAAFASIVSPVSLVTIGVVGLTAAAIEYFSTFEMGGGKSEETLKAEAELIQKVASQWGVALPALKAYADEQQRLADQQDQINALVAARENSGAPLVEGFNEATAEIADLQDKLNTLGDNNAAQQLRDKFEELKKQVDDGSVSQQDFNDVISAAKATFADAQINGDNFIKMLESLAGRAGALIPTMKALAGEVDRIFGGVGSPNGRSVRGKTLGYDPRFPLPDNAPTPDSAPNREDQGAYEDKLAARAARSASRGVPKTADDRFFEDIQAIRDRTAALAQEQSMLGLSFEEQTKRKTALDLEATALKQVREEARKKGDADWQNAQLTPKQIADIDAVSEAYARQADELRKAQEAQQFQRDILKGAFDDLRSALDDGKLDWQDFQKIALNALDKIIDKIENDLIDSIMQANSASGGGGLGGILSFLTGSGSSSGPFPGGGTLNSLGGLYDSGGYTGPGGKKDIAGLVHKGEVVFSQDDIARNGGVAAVEAMRRGRAIAAPQMPAIAAPAVRGGDTSVTFAPSISVQGGGNDAGEQVTKALKKFEAEFTPKVVKALKEAKTRGMVA